MTKTILALGALLAAGSANAADFSFSGTFAQDNSKALCQFSVTTPGTVTLTSTGYAAGGFDPVLTLYGYSASDDLYLNIAEADDAGTPDPELSIDLAAGTYFAYLTQYSNFGPIVYGDPFPFDGEPDFQDGFAGRTGDWALTIGGVDAAFQAVPEPASWALMIVGAGAVGGSLRSRRRAAVSFA